MELRRTVPVKRAIGDEQAVLLDETIEQFLWAANYVVDRARQERFCCQHCGYENHAEYNAAKNIAFELLQHRNGAEGGLGVKSAGQ